MRNLLLAASFAVSVFGAMSPATAASFPDKICEGAVSAAACADHKAYLASHPFYGEERDTSPAYFRWMDPRVTLTLLNAG